MIPVKNSRKEPAFMPPSRAAFFMKIDAME
jgi:hypothetical protein